MNIQRFRQVLAYIEKNPKQWDQRTWRSKGPCCFMAHAARIGGRSLGCFYLQIGGSDDLARWLLNSNRTLDDFRTIARRPFA